MIPVPSSAGAAPEKAIGKNLVVCADGTGNSFDTNESNVARLVKCLELGRDDEQLVFYDQGVGTRPASARAARAFKNASHRPALTILDEPTVAWWPATTVARTAGLGFGYGLKENLRQMYEALAGAYDPHPLSRDLDTVKSYGFIYPKSLPHLRHNPGVGTVRHAVALHERRSYYQLTSWGGVDHPLYEDTHPGDSSDVKEVWFAGSHSDVGGGFPPWRNGLARAPFEWMVRLAHGYGLHVSGARLDGVLKELGTELALNESLRGGWWIAELLPRFELENIPFPGQRVLKWGSTGARDPLTLKRGNRVSVHATALAWHQAADLPFIPAENVTIEGE